MGKEASILVRILGDADSAKKATEDTESAFSKMGDNLGKIGLAIGAAFAAAGVAALVGLEKLGSSFDDASDKIVVGTGATGVALDDLKASFKNVVSNVPTDFGSASTAIADINTALGLTGKPLEALSTQFLNLSRITGTDVAANIKTVTGAFNLWGISAEEQGHKLDELFTISQATGVSVSDLGQQMADGGVQFQQAGLSFEESASLLGTLSKNGLSASDVLPALSKAMAVAAKEGKPANEVFKSIFEQIQNAPTDTAAASLAFTEFGAKAGPKFAALIRSGALSYEELAATIGSSANTINDTATATDDWREKLQLLMNKAMVKLEPLATAVFNKITEVVQAVSPYLEQFAAWLGEKIPAVIAVLKAKFDEWAPTVIAVFQQIRDAVATAFQWLMDNKEFLVGILVAVGLGFGAWAVSAGSAALATVAAAAPFIALGAAIAAAVGGIIYAYNHFETFRTVIDTVVSWLTDTAWPAIKTAIAAIGDVFNQLVGWVRDNWAEIQATIDAAINIVKGIISAAVTAILFLWDHFGATLITGLQNAWEMIKGVVEAAVNIVRGIIQTVTSLIRGDWSGVWEGIKDIFSGIWDAMKAIVQGALDGIKLVLSLAWDAIKIAISAAWDGIKAVTSTAWDLIKSAIMTPINAAASAVSSVWDGIKSFVQTVITWISDKVDWVVRKVNSALQALNSLNPFSASVGGSFNAKIPGNASGTDNWRGGLTRVNELGGEIMNLPRGTQIIPHDVSMAMAQGSGGGTVNFMPGATVNSGVDIAASYALLQFQMAG